MTFQRPPFTLLKKNKIFLFLFLLILVAPEVIEMELVPNEKADIWSLGCTVIELYTGSPPYSEFHPMVSHFPPFSSSASSLTLVGLL